MSKELEALERMIDNTYYVNDNNMQKDADILKSALERLEAIDNANPSEALECLERIHTEFSYRTSQAGYECLSDDDLKDLETIKQTFRNAEKEHNSVNLLMQELDCKDFAELRKYARCGYDKMNKKYLKWEDLEFGKTSHKLKVKMNDILYRIEWCNDDFGANVVSFYKYITNDYLVYCSCIKENGKQFFNDLHLEVLGE